MLNRAFAQTTDTTLSRPMPMRPIPTGPIPTRAWQETVSEGNLGYVVGKQRITHSKPDLFSQPCAAAPLAIETIVPPASAPPQRGYLLPRDLSAALKTLNDHELALLGHGLMEEQARRKGKEARLVIAQQDVNILPPSAPNAAQARKPARVLAPASRPPKMELQPMTAARICAVRASFKAGVKPGTTARQFGVTQAQVREALTRV